MLDRDCALALLNVDAHYESTVARMHREARAGYPAPYIVDDYTIGDSHA